MLKVTPEDIRRLGVLVVDAIKAQGVDFVVKPITLRFAQEHGNISSRYAFKLLRAAFPKDKLSAGVAPEDLAEQYIQKNVYFSSDTKYVHVKELLAKNPNLSYTELAKITGMPEQTIRTRLVAEKTATNLTSRQRGERVLAGRGLSVNGKMKYNRYISKETLEKLKLILKQNNKDLVRSLADYEKLVGDGKKLFNDIFPAYMVERFGVDDCIQRYEAWLATNPKSNLTPKQREGVKEYIAENREKRSAAHRKRNLYLKAMRALTKMLGSRVTADTDIENKDLFMKVAIEIFNGENGVMLSKKYNLPELTVVGIRRRMMDYIFSYQTDLKMYEKRKIIIALLGATRFYKTFNDNWVSPKNLEYVRRTSRIVDLRIESLTREVEKQLKQGLLNHKPEEHMVPQHEVPVHIRPKLRR